jgi:hypothetical protein
MQKSAKKKGKQLDLSFRERIWLYNYFWMQNDLMISPPYDLLVCRQIIIDQVY